jgi:hypothetical protein
MDINVHKYLTILKSDIRYQMDANVDKYPTILKSDFFVLISIQDIKSEKIKIITGTSG